MTILCRMDNPGETENSNTGSKGRIFTAIQHSAGLVALLGLFLAISAWNTGRNPEMLSVGLIMIVLGLIGFLGGWVASRQNRARIKKD